MQFHIYHLYTETPQKSLQELLKYEGRRAICDADKVICAEQVHVALERAIRAIDRSNNIAKDWGIEILLHIAGTHQISEALKIVNVTSETKCLLIIQEAVSEEDNFEEGFPEFTPSPDVIDSYGLTAEDLCMEVISRGVNVVLDHE